MRKAGNKKEHANENAQSEQITQEGIMPKGKGALLELMQFL